MSPQTIYVTIVRPGKAAQTVDVPAGSTVEDVFRKAGFSESDYRNWHITDEDGDSLSLSSTLFQTTQIVAGPRVDGAL